MALSSLIGGISRSTIRGKGRVFGAGGVQRGCVGVFRVVGVSESGLGTSSYGRSGSFGVPGSSRGFLVRMC